MATLYHLRFRSPLHIGERGVGLEETRAYVPADTLFSAISTAWRWLYGTSSLEQQLLEPFIAEQPPFLLTSAFPFAGDVRFYPKPQGRWQNLHIAPGAEKNVKRIRWLSESVFSRWIAGEELSPDDQVMDGAVWMNDDERRSLSSLLDVETGALAIWRIYSVPRVALDRISQASSIWFLAQVVFAREAGLWFAVDYYRDNSLREQVEACLRLLGDSGLGAERGSGYGLFTLDTPVEYPLPEAPDPSHALTLAPCCPRDADLPAFLANDSAYDILPRRGWVCSPEAANLRRKLVYMFAEGSVLQRQQTSFVGQLVDVKPDPCSHHVWRYGYAFLVGVRR